MSNVPQLICDATEYNGETLLLYSGSGLSLLGLTSIESAVGIAGNCVS